MAAYSNMTTGPERPRPTLSPTAGFCGACGRFRPLWEEDDETSVCEDCWFERTGLDPLAQGLNHEAGK